MKHITWDYVLVSLPAGYYLGRHIATFGDRPIYALEPEHFENLEAAQAWLDHAEGEET